MNKNIRKSNTEIAMILITRPSKTEAGRKVAAKLLARIEADISAERTINALIASEL